MSDDTTDLQLWREHPSTEGRPPRVLIRVFVPAGTLQESIRFYEELQGVAVDAVFPYPEVRLALATVGGFLIIEGDDTAVAPFRSTTGTLLVDDVQPYFDRIVAGGAEIVVPLKKVPTGTGFTAKHPDGSVVEYVEHRPDAEGR